MVTSYSNTNVMWVATMVMVLMILSMCGTFDNAVATSTDSSFQCSRETVTINNTLGGTSILQANCTSGDENVGRQQIIPGGIYSISFKP
jgi:hypothetical protein